MRFYVQDLRGRALDWAVAKCWAVLHKDATLDGRAMPGWWVCCLPGADPNHWVRMEDFTPSRELAWAWPIIDHEGITVGPSETAPFAAYVGPASAGASAAAGDRYSGPTALVAAMRCFVARRLGNEVDVPDDVALGHVHLANEKADRVRSWLQHEALSSKAQAQDTDSEADARLRRAFAQLVALIHRADERREGAVDLESLRAVARELDELVAHNHRDAGGPHTEAQQAHQRPRSGG